MIVPLADKPRDPVRSEKMQNEIALLGTVWDMVMELRIKERGHVVDFHGMRMFADSSLREGNAISATHYFLKRIQEGYDHVPVWTAIWGRYSFSFEGSREQYEKDLAVLKMFVA